LQPINDYVKVLILQFEELYQELPFVDLKEQAKNLKHRLIAGYVKTQKQLLLKKMQTTSDEKELRKIIRQVDKLNKVLKLSVDNDRE